VFAEGNKKAVLQISFREKPGWGVGYPAAGVIWSIEESKGYNLNRPAVVAALVRYTIQCGWDPGGENPLEIRDGIPLLSSAAAPSE